MQDENLRPPTAPLYRPRSGPVHSFAQGGASVRALLPSADPRADYLVAAVDHPIQLLSGWKTGVSDEGERRDEIKPQIERSWSLEHGTQDAYLHAYAIDVAYLPDQDPYLIVGADKTIAIFDYSRLNGPVHRRNLGSSFEKSLSPEGPTFLSGSISALSCNHQLSLVAAGSHTRGVAIFDNYGTGRNVLSFSLKGSDTVGGGVSHLKWSLLRPWYLYVVERDSDCALLYDVRTGVSEGVQPLSVMTGRNAYGQLKLGAALCLSENHDMSSSFDDYTETIICGGSDGSIRGWENAWESNADDTSLLPSWSRKIDTRGITEILVHPEGGLITCAAGDRRVRAQREWWDDDSESDVVKD